MAAKTHSNTLDREYEIGGGKGNRRVTVVTGGRLIAEFESGEPVLIMPTVSADPTNQADVTKSGFFFRDRGDGKLQCCVRFPTGAVQILATEP